jgi:hypothetical protein
VYGGTQRLAVDSMVIEVLLFQYRELHQGGLKGAQQYNGYITDNRNKILRPWYSTMISGEEFATELDIFARIRVNRCGTALIECYNRKIYCAAASFCTRIEAFSISWPVKVGLRENSSNSRTICFSVDGTCHSPGVIVYSIPSEF